MTARSFQYLLDTELFDHWTIVQLDTTLSDHWMDGHSTFQRLDSWTQLCPTIGQLDTALSDHWTVENSLVLPLESWTQH